MSEAGTVAKIVIALGIVFVLVGLLYPGEDTGWTTFSDTIQAFPTFVNPFDQNRAELQVAIVNDGSVAPDEVVDNATVDNCDTSATPVSNWWGCLTTEDQDVSFVRGDSGFQFRVEMGNVLGLDTGLPVLAARFQLQCRGFGGTEDAQLQIYKADDVTSFQFLPPTAITCTNGVWFDFDVLNHFDTPYSIVSDWNGANVRFNVQGLTDTDISYFALFITFGTTAECTSGDTLTYIGCIISGFFNFVVKLGVFIVNGLIFIGQIISYVISLAAAFLAMVAFFFAIPDMPPILQGILDAVIIGLLVMVIVAIFRIARGAGATG